MTTLVWFRHDLRLHDHPALHHAVQSGSQIIPVFIWSPEEEAPWQPGAASRWWLHYALTNLDQQLKKLNSRLIVRKGPSQDTLSQVIVETSATKVFWSRRYEPKVIRRDEIIKRTLKEQGVDTQSFNSSLLHEPMSIKTKLGNPYQVYTPFWKAYLTLPFPRSPLPTPQSLVPPAVWPASQTIDSLKLLPKQKWDSGFYESWKLGDFDAETTLESFTDQAIDRYADQRDFPGLTGTSRLSPFLHFGQISPNQIWHIIQQRRSSFSLRDNEKLRQSEVFLKELVWREFAYHLLYHFPHTPMEPLRSDFVRFPWKTESSLLRAWQKGQTGYPLVDAGMRELWNTGWMHNRVRMVVASFLVKHLLIPWQEGAQWFWDTLVDADLASNTLGWQWTAGCGADAAPFFRIFNPIQQSERFDPEGVYLRRWLPELAALPLKYIHAPWTAPESILHSADVQLGKTYPRPIVDHVVARQRALQAFDKMRGK